MLSDFFGDKAAEAGIKSGRALGSGGMKKIRSASQGERELSQNEQALAEIKMFLHALDSYPERFAEDPQISFEDHQSSLIVSGKIETGHAD